MEQIDAPFPPVFNCIALNINQSDANCLLEPNRKILWNVVVYWVSDAGAV